MPKAFLRFIVAMLISITNRFESEKILQVINAKSLGEVPQEELELVIAKRVPFRVAVKMDERRIADFMAACANSPFAFEINQVRINKHDPNGEEIPIGGVSGSDGIGSSDLSAGAAGSGIGGGPGGGGTSQAVEIRTNFDVNVEFYGIVKIYNPVREDLLREAIGLQPEGTPDNQPNANDAASVQAAREPKA